MKTQSSRHANPSTAILLARVDRKLNRMERHQKRTMKTLADEFTRILRQNDTLRGENETLKEIIRVRQRLRIADIDAPFRRSF